MPNVNEECIQCGGPAILVEKEDTAVMTRGPYEGKTVTTVYRYYRCESGCVYEEDNLIEPLAWVDPELYQENYDKMMEKLKEQYG